LQAQQGEGLASRKEARVTPRMVTHTRSLFVACTQTTALYLDTFLARAGNGTTTLTFPQKHRIYSQGDAADAVFYLQAGRVKLTVVSQQGKEAILAILERGAFLGEACLAGQTILTESATTVDNASLVRLDKDTMIRLLHEEPRFAESFMAYLLSHTIRIQENLLDHLFNNSEKRLARVLLLMARLGKEGKPEGVIPKISQETFAEMIGTTRSRVSFFMNKFRTLGFIEYHGNRHANGGEGGLQVHNSLLKFVLYDEVPHPFPLRRFIEAESGPARRRAPFTLLPRGSNRAREVEVNR
jgi:CRP/FNR family transcriptional regulator, cyclic AMP receptor protein